MAKTKSRIAVLLLSGAGFAILPTVATQWEVEHPRRNEIGIIVHFPYPASGLLRPAVCSTRLRGMVFANGS